MNVKVTLPGKRFTLMPALAKLSDADAAKGKTANTYWVLCKKNGSPGAAAMYGNKLPQLADTLPESVVFDLDGQQVTVVLSRGTTTKGKLKVSGKTRVKVAALDGVEKDVMFAISLPVPGCWNVTAKVIGVGSAGGGGMADFDDFDCEDVEALAAI
jgi:hypothetical protein